MSSASASITSGAASRLAQTINSAAARLARSGKVRNVIPKHPKLGSKRKPLRVCVLSSGYEGTASPTSEFDNFVCGPQNWVDSARYTFDTKTIDKIDSYRAVRELIASEKYDLFFNLCDGARDEKRSGVDVLNALEEHNAAFTGTDWRSFEPNKIDMKILVGNAGVRTPNFVLLTSTRALAKKCRHLKFPVIVKHVSGYASVGIFKDNRCDNMDQLAKKLSTFIPEFNHALVEEFIRGKEGTVLTCRDPQSPYGIKVFRPMMFDWLATADDFAHFDSKWKSEWGEFRHSWLKTTDPAYEEVVHMARNSFHHVLNGVGYGRSDFRIDEKGHAYFLEINPNCGMWYPKATEGDFADQMVLEDPDWTHERFVDVACQFALEQQQARVPWYVISHDSHGHFTTRASRMVDAGRFLFGDGVHPIPVVAKSLYHLGGDAQQDSVGCVIRRADGIQQVVALRHSCEPNMTLIHGQTLTCGARRQINVGEELTIDYGAIRDMNMPTFACRCGTVNCRSVILPHPPMPRSVDHKRLRKLLRERKKAALASRAHKQSTASAQKHSEGTTPPAPVASPAVDAAVVAAADTEAASPVDGKGTTPVVSISTSSAAGPDQSSKAASPKA